MDIGNKYLRSWLRFDESATKDFIANNIWTVSGNPTISTTNAISGNALQLSGERLSMTTQLGGRSFTFDCWLTMDNSTESGGRILDIVNPTNGYSLVIVRRSKAINYPNTLEFWANNSAGVTSNTGGSYRATTVTTVGRTAHIALIYRYSATSTSYLQLYVDGVRVCNYSSAPRYTRGTFDVRIGHSEFVGTIDEFRFYDGGELWSGNFTPPDAAFYNSIEFYPDIIRLAKIPSEWRYENIGEIDTLINTNTAVQLTNLPATQSRTGKAFYQTTQAKIFDVASSRKIWLKFDVYFDGVNRWRAYDRYNTSNNTGITAQTDGSISFFNRSTNVYAWSNGAKINSLQTVILHMIADSTNGLIEAYTDDGGLLYAYTGEINNGTNFSNLYLQSDGAGTFFSNVIISNNPLWFDDRAIEQVTVDYLADAQREISRSLTLLFDTERIVTESAIAVNLSADVQREIVVSTTDMLDAERRLSKDFVLDLDTERIITGVVVQVSLLLDTERKVANVVTVHFDKEWGYFSGAESLFDVEREIICVVNFLVDAIRQIPHRVTDTHTPPTPPEPSPGVVPPAPHDAFLQSVSISLSEQQLTDNITFVATGNFNVMEAVDCQILDYVLTVIIEETTTRDVLTTCKCTINIDALLYQQLAYSVPESKWEYTDEYKEYLRKQGGSIVTDPDYDEAKLKGIPSAPASAHITEIASKLGLNVSLHFVDFISTMNTEVRSGTNYAGLLQELFGWTSRLPHMMINCYIRGGTIYVVQRGQEQNVVILDGQKLTVHTINKKLVRTTWGSDPWSKTEVKPYFNDWQELVKEPLSEEGGESGVSYNDEGLVEETTVEHGDETVVTHYSYETLENGQKFLYQEVATTYSKGVKVDEVTTTHDPIRSTQSHVYSTDADGVLGGVVTSSNNDDRITPWQNEHTDYSGGVVVHDGAGNSYLLKEIIYRSDKGEMAKRTIYGVSMIDTSFPVEGEGLLQFLTEQIIWLNRKIEETVVVDVYDCSHVIDFNDRVIFGGNAYFLRSNTLTINEKTVNRQSLELVRWY